MKTFFQITTGALFILLGLVGYISTASAAPINLIQNPSLETASADPAIPQSWLKGGWGANTRSFTYPVEGYALTSGVAAKVEITSYTSGDAKWYFQYVPVTPGKRYTFSEFYTSNVPSFMSVQFKMTNGTFTYLDIGAQLPATSSWTNVHGSFVVPPNVTSLTVFHVIKQVGHLTTDSFSLIEDPLALNLIQNPTFEILGTNGDPVGWFRGGSGEGEKNYSLVQCAYYNEGDASFRPSCPPRTPYRLFVYAGATNPPGGNANWYFSEVPIGTNKNFTVKYQYQAYTRTAQATARYTFSDGSYSYSLISDMPQGGVGGQGYVGWVTAERDFTAPSGAVSLTILFSVRSDDCNAGECTGPGNGQASIANVILAPKNVSPTPSVNLIANPSFEIGGANGDPADWFRGGWGQNTRTYMYYPREEDGTKVVAVAINSYSSGDAKWYFKEVPVTKGTYTFSNLYSADVPSELGVMYKTPAGNRYEYLATLPISPTNVNWVTLTKTISVPSDATSMTIFHSIYKVGRINLDAFSLTRNNP